MVSLKSVEAQLKRIKFNHHAWGRAEAEELPNILLEGENIFEAVNGIYEGGFALLVATNVRLLLVDKKPFKFLTVEDLRFDMITEIDYNHRMFGARINVSSGTKNLQFRSYNQQRLRKLIGHVQHCMADTKKEQSKQANSQQQHLEQINQQLQAYLLAQHQQQEVLRKQLEDVQQRTGADLPALEPIRPNPQLSDYLFAQNLLKQYEGQQPGEERHSGENVAALSPAAMPPVNPADNRDTDSSPMLADLYTEGMREIFGSRRHKQAPTGQPSAAVPAPATPAASSNPLEINPLRIAYSKLPMVLRNRKFGRSSFQSSQQPQPTVSTP
jgi:hypothetical protein